LRDRLGIREIGPRADLKDAVRRGELPKHRFDTVSTAPPRGSQVISGDHHHRGLHRRGVRRRHGEYLRRGIVTVEADILRARRCRSVRGFQNVAISTDEDPPRRSNPHGTRVNIDLGGQAAFAAARGGIEEVKTGSSRPLCKSSLYSVT